MAKGKFEKARVLVALFSGGIAFKPNDLMEADAKTIKFHKDQGEVDDSPEALEYCVKVLKVKAKKVEGVEQDPPGITKEEAEKAVTDAEAAVTAATTEEEKTKANEALEGARKVLAELG